MTDQRQAALDLVAEMISQDVSDFIATSATSSEFGAYIGELSLNNVFSALWLRPGLSRRDRSLVTLGILIALRATEELSFHIPIALKNGLTEDELAEVIYHSSGYAGFPAAASARNHAVKILANRSDPTMAKP